jgi:hypothetical protein
MDSLLALTIIYNSNAHMPSKEVKLEQLFYFGAIFNNMSENDFLNAFPIWFHIAYLCLVV